MPSHDAIQDAFELLPGGAPVTLDTVGVTDPDNFETDFLGEPAVWFMVDLSDYFGTVDVEINLGAATGAGFHPYVEVVRVTDATFDPTAPDISKVDYVSGGVYIGDGTAGPFTETFPLEGGPLDASGSSTYHSETGIFYFHLAAWDYDGTEGTTELSYDVPDPPECIMAADVINPASTTATVVGSPPNERVNEAEDGPWDFGYPFYPYPERTLKWTWTLPAGAYRVYVQGQMEATASNGQVRCYFFVNGRVFSQPEGRNFNSADGTNPKAWWLYNFFPRDVPDVYSSDDYQLHPWIIAAPGDIIEVFALSFATKNGIGGHDPFEIERLCFTPIPEYDGATCTTSYNFPVEPLGDQWGSEEGWGGQKLIPDELWVDQGITPYDDSNFPWGVNWTDNDMVALDDGTVYVIFKDSNSGSTPLSTFWTVIKKYDPGLDDWTQIHTIGIDQTGPGNVQDGVIAHLGPDGFVYFAWWEITSIDTGPTPDVTQWDWHCIKLDPSDDTYVELGTGQHSITAGDPGMSHVNYPFNTLAPDICVAANGDVYVTTIENRNGTPSFDQGAYVWRWDGATWTDLALPPPTTIGSDGTWEAIGENGFWDRLVQVVCARPDEGPVNDGCTVIYAYSTLVDNDPPESEFFGFLTETIQYTVGTGWHDPITTDWLTTLGRETRTNETTVLNARILPVDMDLLWSAKLGRLVLCSDFLANVEEIWDFCQLNEGNTQWESIDPIAPPSSNGTWNQTRNSAAISPIDGDLYALRLTPVSDDFETWLQKQDSGYDIGSCIGTRNPLGYGAAPAGWMNTLYASQNHRLRFTATHAYVMVLIYAESLAYGDGDERWGEGVYVFKLPYVPCAAAFRPHIYRRVLG